MLYRLQKKDITRAASVLADAFAHDPLWTRLFQGESRYEEKFRAFFEIPVRYGLRYGEVIAPSPELEGVAVFLPGNLADMTLWRTIASGAIMPGMKLGPRISRIMQPVFAPVQKDRRESMGKRPYLYLFIIGVGSKYQGQGFGKNLVTEVIRRASANNRSVYLETETEENVRWYEKLGFRVITRIMLKTLNLPMWEMVREAESGSKI